MLLKLINLLCAVCAGAAVIRTDLNLWLRLLAGVGAYLGAFVSLLLLAVAFLAVCCALVDYNKPQTQDSPFYRKLAAVYVEALIGLFHIRVHTRGLEKTPGSGRFVLVCNHLFDADPGILLHYFKDSQLAFISKKENRRLPFVGRIMHKILCQLIDRDNDRAALRTIIDCINIIKEDKASIAVFPEGYCSKDGRLQPFRPGVFKIAMKAKVPIVVCTIQNTKPVIKNGLRLKTTDVHLHLVDVLQPEDFAQMKSTQLSEKVFSMMLEDLGPDFAPAQT